METKLFDSTIEDIKEAAKVIAGGGLIAFPTETVYGLGADALNGKAVSKVYKAKGRPSDNPMIVHIYCEDQLLELTENITDDMKILMENFWPGPLTMIVPRKPIIPDVTTGGLNTVGIRMPSNATARCLIKESGCPIAAPSANLSGKPSPTTAQHCIDDLTGRVDGIIMGEACDLGIESTVIDMTEETPTILRPGLITKEEISAALDKRVAFDHALLERPDIFNNEGGLLETGKDFKPKSPGMKYKHYAPKAEMIIYQGDKEKVRKEIDEVKEIKEAMGKKVGVIIYEPGDAKGAAKDFFARLREFDKNGTDIILAAALEEEGVGFSVMNRMFKSAGYNIKEI